jgi:hypothetical protein
MIGLPLATDRCPTFVFIAEARECVCHRRLELTLLWPIFPGRNRICCGDGMESIRHRAGAMSIQNPPASQRTRKGGRPSL